MQLSFGFAKQHKKCALYKVYERNCSANISYWACFSDIFDFEFVSCAHLTIYCCYFQLFPFIIVFVFDSHIHIFYLKSLHCLRRDTQFLYFCLLCTNIFSNSFHSFHFFTFVISLSEVCLNFVILQRLFFCIRNCCIHTPALLC